MQCLADAVWLKAEQVGLPLPAAMIEAERLVNEALRLDSNLAEALTTRAKIAQERLDFPTAEAVYKRVFELNPSYAPAYGWYSATPLPAGAGSRGARGNPARRRPRSDVRLEASQHGLVSREAGRPLAVPRSGWRKRGRSTRCAAPGRWARRWRSHFPPDSTRRCAGSGVAHDFDPQAVNSLVRAARWHLELDDPSGARIWLENAMKDGRQV